MSLYLFRLIEIVFRSIEYRESGFLKNGSWLFQKHFFKSFLSFLSLSLSLSPIQTWLHLRFLSFFIILFARFLSPNTGKTLLPFFLFLLSHFTHFNLGISKLYIFGVFDDLGHIFWNWSLGFDPMKFLTWYLLENLINLEICEKSKILGLILNPIWGFCSIWFYLIKLACWLDVIDHYFV